MVNLMKAAEVVGGDERQSTGLAVNFGDGDIGRRRQGAMVEELVMVVIGNCGSRCRGRD